MDRALLDTSTVSDIVQPAKRRPSNVVKRFQEYLRARGVPTFSEMSYYEILRGLRKKAAQTQEMQFSEFCRHAELLPVSHEVLERAASLWAMGQQQGMIVDDGDLIIASTAARLRLASCDLEYSAFRMGR